jgi:hypothetical protein
MEVFRLKHDIQLTAAHLGRCLMPNLMMANSTWRPAPTTPVVGQRAGAGPVAQAPDPEPLLSLLSASLHGNSPWRDTPAGSYGPALSPISRHYLEKMRALCRDRHIRLHVLPCPLSRKEIFADAEQVYAMRPMQVDPALLVDAVHFQRQYVPEMRRQVIEYYHLPLDHHQSDASR